MKRCKTIPAVLAISLLALTAWALTGPGGSGDPSPVNRSSRGVPETVSTNREVYTTPDIAPLIPKDLTITLTGDGAGIGSTILCGQPFNFTIWLYNRTDENISEFDLGFRLYSPEGATWAVPTLGLNPELLLTYFGPDVFPYLGSLDGSGADTIGLEAGYGDLGPGLPPDFVGYLWTITTELDCADTGATYCIDSCWFPPSGNWHWNLGGGGSTNPKWGGPYCFALQVGGSFCDTIYFQYDADSPDTVHFATNIERPDSVYVRFQPFVHVLPPQTPITILYDDEESGYQFEVGDIDLINHELTYEDTLMWKLPEGEHLYQANLGDIVTCERLFATEDKPLADAWFAHSDASFDTLGEFYDINSIVPQWSAPYLYRDTFTLFQRLMENRLSYDVYIYQDFNLDGSQDITLDDTIRFILFGASVLSTDAGVSVWEEEDPRVFNFASPVVGLTTSPLKLFEGVWVQFTVGGDILSVTVGGTIKHTDGSWTVDGTLYAPPEPFWGRLDFVSELEIAAKAFGEIKILAGLASAKVDITSDFRYDIATGISRGPDTLEINTELCRIFKLDWKATLKFLWKTKKYSGHLTLMDSCPGGKLYIDDFLTGATAGLSLTNVEDDNYYGPPALASNALKTMAVFVRTEGFEDQEIYFSELDPGSSWSTPVALTSSGRPKVHPDVTAHGDSSFVAVWAENVN
ncbi:MAG: hypothetical protein OEV80_12780, partial [candidate division Zixibacteria bacterium]|nr:hypothetical protein [candidate division Zixibacteria bacterium]